ncbi:hypothetical protein TWF481_006914 [Arthrobotrys musiformis]|uniref:F-box domain-containing protein n=1 Tax=Arthrobotrys musiformis TaxID=47236 RepID=A0AAV9WBS6_9PEZI
MDSKTKISDLPPEILGQVLSNAAEIESPRVGDKGKERFCRLVKLAQVSRQFRRTILNDVYENCSIQVALKDIEGRSESCLTIGPVRLESESSTDANGVDTYMDFTEFTKNLTIELLPRRNVDVLRTMDNSLNTLPQQLKILLPKFENLKILSLTMSDSAEGILLKGAFVGIKIALESCLKLEELSLSISYSNSNDYLVDSINVFQPSRTCAKIKKLRIATNCSTGSYRRRISAVTLGKYFWGIKIIAQVFGVISADVEEMKIALSGPAGELSMIEGKGDNIRWDFPRLKSIKYEIYPENALLAVGEYISLPMQAIESVEITSTGWNTDYEEYSGYLKGFTAAKTFCFVNLWDCEMVKLIVNSRDEFPDLKQIQYRDPLGRFEKLKGEVERLQLPGVELRVELDSGEADEERVMDLWLQK